MEGGAYVTRVHAMLLFWEYGGQRILAASPPSTVATRGPKRVLTQEAQLCDWK